MEYFEWAVLLLLGLTYWWVYDILDQVRGLKRERTEFKKEFQELRSAVDDIRAEVRANG